MLVGDANLEPKNGGFTACVTLDDLLTHTQLRKLSKAASVFHSTLVSELQFGASVGHTEVTTVLFTSAS